MNNNSKVVLVFGLAILLSVMSNTYKVRKVKLEPFLNCKNCEHKSNIGACLLCPECGWCQTMGQDGACVQQDSYGFPLFNQVCNVWTPGGYYPFNEPPTDDSFPYYYEYGYPWYNPWSWFRGWPWKRVGPNQWWGKRNSWRKYY